MKQIIKHFIDFIVELISIAFMIAPFIAGALLTAMVSPYFALLLLVSMITIPIGFYIMIKSELWAEEEDEE